MGEHSKNFIPIEIDLLNSNKIVECSKMLKDTNRIPSLFILNAAIGIYEKDGILNMKEHESVFKINYFGIMYWISEWLAYALNCEHKITFVGLSSLAAYAPDPHFSSYVPPKMQHDFYQNKLPKIG